MSRTKLIDNIKHYIEDLFKNLQQDSVRCCLLRRNLETWDRADDLDIMVDKISIDVAASIADSTAKKHDAVILYEVSDRLRHRNHLFVSFPGELNNNCYILHIDFQSSIYEADCVFAAAGIVFEYLDSSEEIPCLAPPMEAAIKVVRAVAGKGYFKPHYWSYVRNISSSYEVELRSLFTRIFNYDISNVLLSTISANDEAGVLVLRSQMIDSVHDKCRLCRLDIIVRLVRRLRWLVSPPGVWIDIIGSDRGQRSKLSAEIIDSLAGLPCKVALINCRSGCSSINKIVTKLYIIKAISDLATYIFKIRPVLAKSGIALSVGYKLPIVNYHSIEKIDAYRNSNIDISNFEIVPQPDLSIHLVAKDVGPSQEAFIVSTFDYASINYASGLDAFRLYRYQPYHSDMVQIHNELSNAFRRKRIRSLSILGGFGLSQGKVNIAFIGLDGAGKGTYIQLLLKHYEVQGVRCKCCYLGYSAYQLAWLKAIEELRKCSRSRFINRLLWIAYIALLPAEFLIRRGTGKYDIVITDRHPRYEPVFRNGFLQIYDRFNAWLCPQPDVVLYLTGDDKILWSRKREYDFHSYSLRRLYLDELVQRFSKTTATIVINTEGNIENVFHRILDAISRIE